MNGTVDRSTGYIRLRKYLSALTNVPSLSHNAQKIST